MLINRKIKVLLLVMLCSIVAKSDNVYYKIEDGKYHTIDDGRYETSMKDIVQVDCTITNLPGTHIDFMEGASTDVLDGWHYSTIDVYGGEIKERLGARHNCAINLYGGNVETIYAGGGSPEVIIYGGSIGTSLMATESSSMYIVGDNFTVNGISVSLYENIKNYSNYEMIGNEHYGYTGIITGMLLDGSLLNCSFAIVNDGSGLSNANIYLIPEPCTILLLGLGGFGVIRRRK